ncbi:MAG: DUF429 domain-containing protein [Rhizobiaceae bacterium]
MEARERTVAGVDGCKAGWIAVVASLVETPLEMRVIETFDQLVASLPDDAIIAVDMPIGLPDFTGHGGRGPEALVRPLLKERQSSVFSIPSRAAIYAEDASFTSLDAWYESHRRASHVSRQTSEPARAISIQAFAIFPKIREIDALLCERPDLRARIYESHPEVAFWQLNGGKAMSLPKKVKGKINPDGMEQRRHLLAASGFPPAFLEGNPPKGAAADDFLDAAAMCLVARRIARGEAISFPDPPRVDSRGIPIAIWC